ncbi:hypothetical protein ACQUQU_03365 [Thalassolituus sp. LLYu03]|uniref:hypothetical protein n=1 Tax=Thalassolituus sp. LLYu03 TaxID=3421656 RepID=UPI003D283568
MKLARPNASVCRTLTLLLIGYSALISSAHAAVQGIVEFPLSYTSLLTFSRSQLQARLCTDCKASVISLNSASQFYEKNTSIDFQQATGLYVARRYKTLSLLIDTRTQTLVKIRFGEFSESSDSDLLTQENPS